MPPDTGAEDSRAATDRLLSGLRAGRWRPGAWRRFLTAAGRRSAEQAVAHRTAMLEVSALHAAVVAVAEYERDLRNVRARWVAASWLLSVTHAGLLEGRAHLGVVNTLTLVRANLPAVGSPLGSGIGAVAAMTDLADGQLARRTGTETRFGQYADAFADAAFWIWYVSVYGNRSMRWAAWLTWLGPTVVVTARSIARGQMVDPPRPQVIRPAATLQVVLALYGLVRGRATDPPARRRRTRTRPGL